MGLQSGLFPGIQVSLVLKHSLVQNSQQVLIVGPGGGHQGKVPGQHGPGGLGWEELALQEGVIPHDVHLLQPPC